MQRYLVRRSDERVLLWTGMLARRKDFEEVYAENPADALKKRAVPNPDRVTLEEIEAMSKVDLIFFARVRLGLILDEKLQKGEMQDAVKERLMMRGSDDGMVAAVATAPLPTPLDVKARSGMVSERKDARNQPDQPVRA